MDQDSARTALVTGANSGIGFDTTLGLADAGCHVVMACRNEQKAHAAQTAILERLPHASLQVMQVDLSDYSSIQTFAKGFRDRYGQLDILINNAGILLGSPKTDDNGTELQLVTNHLGHFLLTALLIDRMPDDPASRIVALSSIAHKSAQMDFRDLTCGGDAMKAYGQSKLACLLFSDELNRRLHAAGRKVKALAVHPGGSDSGLFEEMNRWQYMAFKALAPVIAHSNAEAAKPSLHAALSQDVEGGDYYGPTGLMELRGPVGTAQRNPITQEQRIAERLWTLSEELTGQTFPL